MIPFFRKIRYKLAQDNQPASPAGRFLKYSRYAIGEIVLVVVGILIALQINNWNEERKNENVKQVYLKSFKYSKRLLGELSKISLDLITELESHLDKHYKPQS